uniref:Hexosyltransferase n=1 Tax=Chrysotila carterae TaxID=13221 RepID=A0A6S9YND5_CHRCT
MTASLDSVLQQLPLPQRSGCRPPQVSTALGCILPDCGKLAPSCQFDQTASRSAWQREWNPLKLFGSKRPSIRSNLLSFANSSSDAKPLGCRGGAYATYVSGERYIPGVLCLQRRLRRVQSACPLLVLFDDRPGHSLTPKSLDALRDGVNNAGSLISLTQLLARLNVTSPSNVWDHVSLQHPSNASMKHGTIGRRLFDASEWDSMYIKLWFWALPERYKRIVVLDSDVLLLRNVDELMHFTLRRIAAVPALGCSTDVFNGGVLILRPSLLTLKRLLHTVVGKICENKITDQSVMNIAFRGSWQQLAYSYNVPFKLLLAAPRLFWKDADVAVVHFLSEPKPWDTAESKEKIGAATSPARARADRRHAERALAVAAPVWRRVCG